MLCLTFSTSIYLNMSNPEKSIFPENVIILLLRLFFPLFLLFQLYENVNAQTGWVQQNSGTSLNLFSIRFLNENTGWAAGDSGLILKTTDAGNNWVSSRFGNTLLRAMHFIDENTGVIVGGNYPPPIWGSPTRIIIRTTNGGVNWNTIMNTYDTYFTNIQFVNDSVGFIGFYGVYKSADKGSNWEHFGNIVNQNCFFINENTGYAANGYISTIHKSTNGGINWINVLKPGMYNVDGGIFFCNQNTGFVTGASGIFKTTDAGSAWQQIWYDDFYFRDVGGIFFSDPEHGVILAHQNFPNSYFLQLTTNGGYTWHINYSPSRLRSVFFINNMTGWIAGDQGKILKTTTGGLTYVSQSSNLVPNNYFLYQNYPNPFNPSTNIKFEIPSSLYVTIKVYSVLGREVATLINEFLNEGSYQIEFNGSNLESGIYFYRIQAGDFTEEKSMIMLK